MQYNLLAVDSQWHQHTKKDNKRKINHRQSVNYHVLFLAPQKIKIIIIEAWRLLFAER
jgi:hypothetical protein